MRSRSPAIHLDGVLFVVALQAIDEIAPLWAKVGFAPWVRVTSLAAEE